MYLLGLLIIIAILTSDAKGCNSHPEHLASDEAAAAADEGFQQRLEASEVDVLKEILLMKLGLERPPSREEVAGHAINSTNDEIRLPNVDMVDTTRRRGTTSSNAEYHHVSDRNVKQFASFSGKATATSPTTINEDSSHFVRMTFDDFTLPTPDATDQHHHQRPERVKILSAKLHLFFSSSDGTRTSTRPSREDRGLVEIYQIDNDDERQLLDTRSVPLGESIWRTFDVTDAVHDWQYDREHSASSSNTDLWIQFSSADLQKSLIVESSLGTESHTDYDHQRDSEESSELILPTDARRPRIDVTYKTRGKSTPHRQRGSVRARRSLEISGSTNCISGESTCCREQRTVYFADLGWDFWVTAPDHFTLYHCRGTCPQGHRMANNYATIKSQLHVLNPSLWGSPCCTASRLGDLSIQHMTSKGYQEAVVEDIIVEECMCV